MLTTPIGGTSKVHDLDELARVRAAKPVEPCAKCGIVGHRLGEHVFCTTRECPFACSMLDVATWNETMTAMREMAGRMRCACGSPGNHVANDEARCVECAGECGEVES